MPESKTTRNRLGNNALERAARKFATMDDYTFKGLTQAGAAWIIRSLKKRKDTSPNVR